MAAIEQTAEKSENPYFGPVIGLIRGGVVHPEGHIDTNEAVRILEQYGKIVPEANLNRSEQDNLTERAKRAMQQSIKAFVRHGDISAESAIDTGRFFRPSRTIVNGSDGAEFFYMYGKIDNPEHIGRVIVGSRYLFRSARIQGQRLKQNGIFLTDEQVLDVCLREATSHEYGHAADTATSWRKYMTQLPTGEEASVGDYDKFRSKIHREIFDTTAVDDDLTGLISDEPEDDVDMEHHLTSVERISMGFEFLGLQYALEELEVPPTKIQAHIDATNQASKVYVGGMWEIYSEARALNLKPSMLSRSMINLCVALSKIRREDLRNLIEPNFTAEYLGYGYPLTRAQIQSMM